MTLSPKSAKWLKAGGIFAVSLTAATALGFGLASLFPASECDFTVLMNVEEVDEGLRAEITRVGGEYQVDQVVYRILRRDDGSFDVLAEGSLSEALTGGQGVTYHQQQPAAAALMPGDYLLVDGLDGTDVILLTSSGTPLGWTAGCEA